MLIPPLKPFSLQFYEQIDPKFRKNVKTFAASFTPKTWRYGHFLAKRPSFLGRVTPSNYPPRYSNIFLVSHVGGIVAQFFSERPKAHWYWVLSLKKFCSWRGRIYSRTIFPNYQKTARDFVLGIKIHELQCRFSISFKIPSFKMLPSLCTQVFTLFAVSFANTFRIHAKFS